MAALFDSILGLMNLNPDDEYEDDFYDEEDDDEYEEEKHSFFKKKNKEPEYIEDKAPRTNSKITPIRSSKRQQGGISMEVCVIKPGSIDDTREIADTLLNGRTVILNVEGLNFEIAQRIIDFTCGSCYAINGNLQKVSNYIFIVTPSNVELSGDFQELITGFDGAGSASTLKINI